jgi:hypothetical protein
MAIAGLAMLCVSYPARADTHDRPSLYATPLINGHPARLVMDTGASQPVLFSNRLEALGLHLQPLAADRASDPPPWVLGETEECSVVTAGTTSRTLLTVISMPSMAGLDADGWLGWLSLPPARYFLCAAQPEFSNLAADERLEEVSSWPMFRIDTNAGTCVLTKYLSKKRSLRILIDTGAENGIYLPPAKWAEWRKRHAQAPATVEPVFMLDEGTHAQEIVWADDFALGPLKLRGVPCSLMKSLDPSFDAALGWQALCKLDIVFDKSRGTARIAPCPDAENTYEDHNRLGATFFPLTESTPRPTAAVASPSPASRADIRDGDVLLRMDEVETAGWQTNKTIGVEVRARLRQPAGTYLTLKLRRGDAVLTKKIKLEDILPPRRKLSQEN